MKNIKYYCESSMDFHEEAVKSKKNTKKDPSYKKRLAGFSSKIKEKFEDYDALLVQNRLIDSVCVNYDDVVKKDLLKLYSYGSKLIQGLKIKLTTTEENRINSTCQNCTINAVNSFDHILPEQKFTEYVVNPKNLFPSCTECNGYKSVNYQNDGKPLFLNLYLDILPEVQYLFVDVTIINQNIETRFYLNNCTEIDDDFYRVIETHYTRLHLFKRFKENSDSVISELENSIRPYIGNLQKEQIISANKEKFERDRKVFGYNYWKAVLGLALIDSDDFINMIYEE